MEKIKKEMLKKKSADPAGERKEGEKENVKERETVTHEYYSSRPKTFDTMLGGFTQVHDPDIQESQQLLKNLFKVRADPVGEREGEKCLCV